MWQLYQFPLCPFSRKVRLLLSEKGVGYELWRENPWEGRDEFLTIPEMLLLGDMVSAAEAKELGLVNRVVEADETVNAAIELGRKIAEKPKATLKIGKEAFYRQLEMTLEDAYAYASTVMVEKSSRRSGTRHMPAETLPSTERGAGRPS